MPKEDRQLQLRILKRLESHEYEEFLFEQFAEHEDGFEIGSSPEWSVEEAYNIRLMLDRGELVMTDSKGDEPWLGDPVPCSPYRETYVRLSADGHLKLADAGVRGWFRRQGAGTAQNIMTIIISVVSAVAIAWALNQFGPIEVPPGQP